MATSWRKLKPGTLIEIQDLIDSGRVMLTAVNTKVIPSEWDAKTGRDETPEVMSFCVDGVWISACQDPSDGYRSSMEGLMMVDGVQMNGTSTELEATHVYFTRDSGDGGSRVNEILEMHDDENNEVILRVGTTNTDDYYPCWVAGWYPENLEVNHIAKRQADRQRGREERAEAKRRAVEEAAAAEQVLNAQRGEIGWATW